MLVERTYGQHQCSSCGFTGPYSKVSRHTQQKGDRRCVKHTEIEVADLLDVGTVPEKI